MIETIIIFCVAGTPFDYICSQLQSYPPKYKILDLALSIGYMNFTLGITRFVIYIWIHFSSKTAWKFKSESYFNDNKSTLGQIKKSSVYHDFFSKIGAVVRLLFYFFNFFISLKSFWRKYHTLQKGYSYGIGYKI